MKYIEELECGEFFILNNNSFIKTMDFKDGKTRKHLCVSIKDGKNMWIESSASVDILDLYRRDNDGNILPIREYKDVYKEHGKDQNFS